MIFPAGSTNASFDIVIINDTVLESEESFQLTIVAVTNGHSVDNAGFTFVTILDTTGKKSCYVHIRIMYIV